MDKRGRELVPGLFPPLNHPPLSQPDLILNCIQTTIIYGSSENTVGSPNMLWYDKYVVLKRWISQIDMSWLSAKCFFRVEMNRLQSGGYYKVLREYLPRSASLAYFSASNRPNRFLVPRNLLWLSPQMKAVAMDMWDPYIAATKEKVPEADKKIVFDKFHVMRLMEEAVDKVRKQEHKELMEQDQQLLKGTKYLWLYSRENIPKQRWQEFKTLKNEKFKGLTNLPLHSTTEASYEL